MYIFVKSTKISTLGPIMFEKCTYVALWFKPCLNPRQRTPFSYVFEKEISVKISSKREIEKEYSDLPFGFAHNFLLA